MQKDARSNLYFALGAYGRNLAIRQATRNSATEAYRFNTGQLREQLQLQNDLALKSIGPAPLPGFEPPEPVFQQGASQLGLAANMAGNGHSGVQMGWHLINYLVRTRGFSS